MRFEAPESLTPEPVFCLRPDAAVLVEDLPLAERESGGCRRGCECTGPVPAACAKREKLEAVKHALMRAGDDRGESAGGRSGVNGGTLGGEREKPRA